MSENHDEVLRPELAHVGAWEARGDGVGNGARPTELWPIDELPVAVVLLSDDEVEASNPTWDALCGLTPEGSTGDGWWSAVHPGDRAGVAAALRRAVVGRDAVCFWRMTGSKGQEDRAVRARVHRHLDAPGGRCVMVVTEIDLDEGGKDRLDHAEVRDSLTGVLSRATFIAELERALAKPKGADALAAVLFIDLDRFKDVNDRFGHQTGDRLLNATSRRIESVLRSSDHLGRLGGDELAVLCPVVASRGDAMQLAERIVRVTGEPFRIDDDVVHTGASVGIGFAEGTVLSASAVLHNADRAMYRAKAEGRGRWAVFSSEAGEPERHHELEAWATFGQAALAVTRAERHILELWRDAIDLRDDDLSTILTGVGHALRQASRLLDRDVAADHAASGRGVPSVPEMWGRP